MRSGARWAVAAALLAGVAFALLPASTISIPALQPDGPKDHGRQIPACAFWIVSDVPGW
jgi:hypothetical protein